jgi:hypothetical protein
LFGDLGVQTAFVAGQCVGGVRAADHDQFGGERAEPLDLLHALFRLAGVNSAQRRPVQQSVESCLGDRSQVVALAARKIQAGPGSGCAAGERAILAVAGDQLSAQPGGLHDAQPLGQRGPSCGLVGRLGTARPQPGQPRLRVGCTVTDGTDTNTMIDRARAASGPGVGRWR